MQIIIIAAVARNRAIGYQNKLLYWLPNDLKRFKALTTGHTIIMGRKTFESLPKGALPNRRNVVLSRQVTSIPGCEVFKSLDAALAQCQEDEEVYVIGGASVYEQFFPWLEKIHITKIDLTPESDRWFPDLDAEADWVCTQQGPWQEEGGIRYCFCTYERQKKTAE